MPQTLQQINAELRIKNLREEIDSLCLCYTDKDNKFDKEELMYIIDLKLDNIDELKEVL